MTAPPPPALIPKGRFGVSIWTWILLDRFHLLRPTRGLLKDLAGHGLYLSEGTITDGLRRLGLLFEPVYLALREKCLREDHWHADETGWLVFETTPDGKAGRRRYLWIFCSPSAVFYILDRSRGSEVPRAFFGDQLSGIISADRYSAYKSLMKDGLVLVAYCWAHVRRDFLRVRDGYPKYANKLGAGLGGPDREAPQSQRPEACCRRQRRGLRRRQRGVAPACPGDGGGLRRRAGGGTSQGPEEGG